MKLLLDTNVWIDYYDVTRCGSSVAKELINNAVLQDVSLMYAVHCLKDVYYILHTLLKARVRAEKGNLDLGTAAALEALAWGCVMNMRELATAVGTDESDVWLAEKYHHVHQDLEDDLVMAAAMRAKADYLVTNDEQLLKHSAVAALSPQDVLTLLNVSKGQVL